MKKGLYPNFGFSGLTSCGKSSHASFFAKKFSMSIISASAALIEQGKRNKLHDVHIGNTHNHPWIRSFDEFNKNRMVDLSIDTSIDEYVYSMISQGYGMIAESLTLPFLLTKRKQKSKTMLFYLHASHEKRVARAFRSSSTLSMEELNIGVLKKDMVSQKIIQNIWGTDILNIE
ncbi:MAG: hypothetical protein Q8K26_04465 [Candidatus Gracilibacteria bacterium]|nr:hypothetical protein [Candidatus Gracilibacteria bacterium]